MGQIGANIKMVKILCIRCLQWPIQAANWPRRLRKYGGPDRLIIDSIVNNGCDLVRVSHQQCKLDPLLSSQQFRISFSRAETVLLNSWTPTQQTVYHYCVSCWKTASGRSQGDVPTTLKMTGSTEWCQDIILRQWWCGQLSCSSQTGGSIPTLFS